MKKILFAIAALLSLTLWTDQSYALTLTSGNQAYLFTTDSSGQNYITLTQMSVGGGSYWAQWKLNSNTLGWDIVNGNIMSAPATYGGPQSASGVYVYDTTKQIFYRNVHYSTFLGNCGSWLGKLIYNVTGLTATTMTLVKIALPGEAAQTLTFTRSGGTAGSIIGQWTSVDNSGNTLTHTYNADGTFTLTGNIVTCN